MAIGSRKVMSIEAKTTAFRNMVTYLPLNLFGLVLLAVCLVSIGRSVTEVGILAL